MKCFFVGYSLTQKAYRFWDPIGRRIKISRDVIFDEQLNDISTLESTFLFPKDNRPLQLFFRQSLPLITSEPQSKPTTFQENPLVPQVDGEIQTAATDTQPEPLHETIEQINPSGVNPPANTQQTSPVSTRVSPYPLRIRQPRRQWESLKSVSSQDEIYEPDNYIEAMQTAEADSWKIAIKDEYDSLILNKTWSISQLPPGRTAIKLRWVFKFKPGVRGSNPRFKARLVAKGFSQRSGIDYGETISPVVKYDTLRVILSFVAANNLEMPQLDIKTAFLYGELDEEIYLKQPEGFVIAGKEKLVCRLHNCLYGLKQASRV